jgi:hypothetical protein
VNVGFLGFLITRNQTLNTVRKYVVWNTLDRSKDDNGFVMGRILEMKNKITWSVYQLSILVVLFGGSIFLFRFNPTFVG